MTNWKSTIAFGIFVGIYVYSVSLPASDNAIDTAGYVALIAMVIMVMRSEMTTELIGKLIDSLGRK